MSATIDWSYDLLSSGEQRLFEHLSVFAGGCTLATVAAVFVGEEAMKVEVLGLLSSLVDKSMVVAHFEGSEPRYRVLESFREYSREKLAMRGEQHIVARRHALACLELAERLDHAYDYEPEVFRAVAQEELDNFRAALHWALSERGDVFLGQRLVACNAGMCSTAIPFSG